MKPNLNSFHRHHLIQQLSTPRHTLFALLLAICSLLAPCRALAVGTWTPLANQAPGGVNVMLLLSDGTVMANQVGDTPWYRLTPDTNGSYVNGTWSAMPPMHDTRLYYASQMLRDGRMFVAGGEYGNGGMAAEVYQPTNNTWIQMPPPTTAYPGANIFDGPAKVLPNGNVLAAPVIWDNDPPLPGQLTLIFDIVSNTWSVGPLAFGSQDEPTWVKLPDGSILTSDLGTTNVERYIPELNQWVHDAPLPNELYGYGGEMGGWSLLPNGKVFCLGSTNHTAIYTPSGNTNAGTWVVGPDIPNHRGLVDAPSATMVNGKVLFAAGQDTCQCGPTYFYEYDYLANAFSPVSSPDGGTALGGASFVDNMLCLPDGTILFSSFGQQLYVYTPDGSPLAAGKPVINTVTTNADGSIHVTGTGFNGISEGSNYGDENQNATDYPIARLTNSLGNLQYARTFNWSSTRDMTGTNIVSTEVTLPAGLLPGTYPLSISANGNSSDLFPIASAGTPLPPVTGLTLTAIASSQMAMSWSPIGSTEAGYVVQRSTDGTSFSTIGSVSSNVTTYADNTVNPLTAYYYRVLGTNEVGLGSAGSVIFAASSPTVALASPWQSQDIGAVAGKGASGQTAGTYTVIGSGSGIGGGSDQFQFASQPMVGDCTITARITAESNTGANALAGVMIRSGLGSSSADAFMAFSGGTANSLFQSRATGSGTAMSTAGPGSLNAPIWVQLVRSGNTITGYTSPNGSSWTQRGTMLVVMPPVVYAGLAVSSGNSNLLNTSTFDNVAVSGTTPLIASPLAYWKLDETSGSTALDSSGNGYDGTYNNCVLGLPGATPGTGNSVGFNGSANISVPPLNLNNNTVTITAWINPNGLQNQYAGVFYGSGGSGIIFGSGNQLGYFWNFSIQYPNSGLVLPTNQWSYVALVIEPTQARLYMITNGVLTSATNYAAHAVAALNGTSVIGSGDFGGFNGQLDEVSFYANQALTPAQLSALASPPVIAISSPLAGAGFLAPATVNLTATVSSTNGHTINLVQLFNNGLLVGQSATPPYTSTLSGLAVGSYALTARLFYDSGLALESSAVNILVQNSTVTPQNVVATALASNLINVTWSSAANANGYILSRDGTPIAAVSSLGYADFGLVANSNYCYSVVATNSASTSSASVSSCAITPATGGALAWDADGSLTGPQDGSGNWSSSSASWWNGSATVNWADNQLALFGVNPTIASTVTITNDVTPAGMVFNATGGGTYTVAGANNILVASGSTITVDGNAAITAPLSGTADFTKSGPGSLVVSNGSPSFNGMVSISAGALEMQAGPTGDHIGYSVGTNAILRHGYNDGGTYTKGIGIHGGGVNASSGLYVARGTTLTEQNITLDTAPTTIRSYGSGGNAQLQTFDSGGENITVLAAASGSTIDSTVNLYVLPYGFRINTESGVNTASGDLVVNGAVVAGSGLIKVGTGSLRLTGANTYGGATTVNAGTLLVDGLQTRTAITVANTATLAGVGVLAIAPTLQSGSTLAPGDNGIGTLTINTNLTLGAGSMTLMELSKTGNTLANDALTVNGTLTYGGALTVTNIGVGILAAGDSFKLFNASAFASSFSSLTLPILAGNLVWNTNLLTINGTIAVASSVNTTPTNIVASLSGNNLNLSWPADHIGWRLLEQTNNLAAGVSSNTNDWATVSGSATTNQVSIAIDPTKPTEFYRLIYP